jgi:hypothetical protein
MAAFSATDLSGGPADVVTVSMAVLRGSRESALFSSAGARTSLKGVPDLGMISLETRSGALRIVLGTDSGGIGR